MTLKLQPCASAERAGAKEKSLVDWVSNSFKMNLVRVLEFS